MKADMSPGSKGDSGKVPKGVEKSLPAGVGKKIYIAITIMLFVVLGYFIFLKQNYLPTHRIQSLISSGEMYEEYRPFSDESIDKVCFIVDGADLRNYGLAKNVDFYGYKAIVEYSGSSRKVGFVKSSQIGHSIPPTDGLAFCTENPEMIVAQKRDIWWLLLKKE